LSFERWRTERAKTVEAETMYTELLLSEVVGDRQVVHYCMEAEDMDPLWEAFGESDDWGACFSE
jgi:hypothetical protein